MKRTFISIFLVVAFVFSAACIPISATDNYSDIVGHWAEAAIREWGDNGIITTFSDGFHPDEAITYGDWLNIYLKFFPGNGKPTDYVYANTVLTREAAIVVLANSFKYSSADATSTFKDNDSISAWAVESVAAMQNAGIVLGDDGYLNPKEALTRAEFIAMLDRCIVLYCASGTFSTDVDGNVIITKTGVTLHDMVIDGDLFITADNSDDAITL
ncbi:MAG: S-layer homology domain-containing protein, partial [Oscillospiraceae bacterium]|nr:S-layer homology domain-containing protein [Oscillospiraceae bacterium]